MTPDSPHLTALSPGQAGYPPALGDLGSPALWLAGQVPPGKPVVAMVGARAASRAGCELAHQLAGDLTEAGALVVSGGAIGIDGASHAGALDAHGPTLAVVAPGLDAPEPARHRPLFAEIVERGGGLLSMEPPGSELRSYMFPKRNAVIAALAQVVVVVECGQRSGSMITAEKAARLGRPVAACPGSPGTQQLIAAGAVSLTSAAQILELCRGIRPEVQVTLPDPESPAGRALAVLDQAASLDRVCEQSGLPVAAASAALIELELLGLCRALPGARWVRARHAAM